MNHSSDYPPYLFQDAPSTSYPSPHTFGASSMIKVLGVAGEMSVESGGSPVSVRINFTSQDLSFAYVRLVIGVIPLQTTVRETDSEQYGRWELSAAAPPQSHHSLPGDIEVHKTAPICVQILDNLDRVIDEVVCGNLAYSSSVDPPTLQQAYTPANAACADVLPYTSQLQSEAYVDPSHITRRRAYTLPSAVESPPSHAPGTRPRAQSIIRLKCSRPNSASIDQVYAGTPYVELTTPLHSMCVGWTESEVQARRRLVRFNNVQHGCNFTVSFAAMSQEEFDGYPPGSMEQDGVVSCIYCPKTHSYHITSVDLIYLLERIVDDEFPVEEKNRIRRNLEGLKPVTISKTKFGYESFFHQIMEFPNPKPRNIEKDLKVFDWNLLGQALEKILSKYAVLSPTSVNEELEESDAPPPAQELQYLPSSDYASLTLSVKTEPLEPTPHLLFSPLLSASADQAEFDRDSDSSSLSGRGWEPIQNAAASVHVETYGNYNGYAYNNTSPGYLFESVRHHENHQFGYDNGCGVTDLHNPMDIVSFVDMSVGASR